MYYLFKLIQHEQGWHKGAHVGGDPQSMLKKGKGKRFARKTKQGGVVTVHREHYVRDDIWCSIQGCAVCKHDQVLKMRVRRRGPLSGAGSEGGGVYIYWGGSREGNAESQPS